MSLDLILPGATATALNIPPSMAYDDWARLGHVLGRMEKAVHWWIGDWLIYGEHAYGEKFAQAVAGTGLKEQYLLNLQWVARSLHTSRRREVLSWGHHEAVAALPSSRADALLDAAETERLSVHDLRERVRLTKNAVPVVLGETCTVEDLWELVRQVEAGERPPFGTTYADPPWLYGNQGTRAATGNHYGGMTVEDLAALPVARLVADNAHLHLWTTNAFLFESKAIMEAWGFEYKSCFVWVKTQMGIGNYWRVSHEFMLFGIRGTAPFRDRGLKSWIEVERGKHSAKPDQVRRLIEKASPSPYLELFGRRPEHGWAVYGNEVRADLLTLDVPAVA